MKPELTTQPTTEVGQQLYPLPCGACHQPALAPVAVPHLARMRYEDRDYFVYLPALRVLKCRHCGELVFDYDADEQLERALRALAAGDDGADLPPRVGVDEYHRLIDAGALTDDDPVELLEGRLVTTMPKKPAHRRATRRLRTALAQLLPDGWAVETQEPITLGDGEPEPDAFVLRGDPDALTDRHPGPDEIALVVEVSDTTLARDRGPKLRSYARAGIPVYWILNLPDRVLEFYSDPAPTADPPTYVHHRDFGPADSMDVVLDGRTLGTLAVSDLLP